jgi:peptidoglycan DL-endopeptidase RipA
VVALCVLGAPAVASATNPSDGQLSAAQQAADDAAQQVERITAELTAAQNQVGRAQAIANIALGRYQNTQAAYDAAQVAAQQAQVAARQAQAAQADARSVVTAFARDSYIQGSTTPDFQAALTSDGPRQLLERKALLAAADAHRIDVLGRLTTAVQQATVADEAATEAAATAAGLQQQAHTDLDAATGLEVQARHESAALQAQQARWQVQLDTAQQTLRSLQDARAAALAHQQQEAAAAAAAAAAATAAATTAQAPAAQAPAAQAPVSQAPVGQAPVSQAPVSQAPVGQAPVGQAPAGQAPAGQAPAGSRPATGGAPVTTPTGPGETAAARTAMAAAVHAVGQMYAWGGGSTTGPSEGFGPDAGVVGFDCSGLTRYAYARAGIVLPRVAADQYAALPKVPSLQPGDLVFYATDPSDPATIHHVAMYLGDGQMVEAPESGERVHVTAMRYGYEYIGTVRPGA